MIKKMNCCSAGAVRPGRRAGPAGAEAGFKSPIRVATFKSPGAVTITAGQRTRRYLTRSGSEAPSLQVLSESTRTRTLKPEYYDIPFGPPARPSHGPSARNLKARKARESAAVWSGACRDSESFLNLNPGLLVPFTQAAASA